MTSSTATGAARQVATSTAFPARLSDTWLVLRAWVRRPWLDRAIARGVEGRGDRVLAFRAVQLVRSRERIRLALRLEELLIAPPRPEGLSSAVPVDRDAVEVARPVLTELILSLRSSDAVKARGVVLGWRLLTDPRSPVYGWPGSRPGNGGRLWEESMSALAALRSPIGAGATEPVGGDLA
jgi:hypothetical protein